jgi:ubiquinone/menaquinone biosynthesis C-methylase UbiE
MNQSKIFLNSEGNAWYKRNSKIISNNLLKKDILLIQLENIIKKIKNKKINILEIGCSNGRILNYLRLKFPKVNVFGLEPSRLAIKNKLSNKIIIKQGVANKIPFQNKKFDFLIYGFCLYLCDTKDLVNIIKEANRVTKSVSYVAIDDFFSKKVKYYQYHHKKGILTRKMDYSKIFLWHPFYTLFFKKIFKYENKIKKNKNLSNSRSVFILKKNEL